MLLQGTGYDKGSDGHNVYVRFDKLISYGGGNFSLASEDYGERFWMNKPPPAI